MLICRELQAKVETLENINEGLEASLKEKQELLVQQAEHFQQQANREEAARGLSRILNLMSCYSETERQIIRKQQEEIADLQSKLTELEGLLNAERQKNSFLTDGQNNSAPFAFFDELFRLQDELREYRQKNERLQLELEQLNAGNQPNRKDSESAVKYKADLQKLSQQIEDIRRNHKDQIEALKEELERERTRVKEEQQHELHRLKQENQNLVNKY